MLIEHEDLRKKVNCKRVLSFITCWTKKYPRLSKNIKTFTKRILNFLPEVDISLFLSVLFIIWSYRTSGPLFSVTPRKMHKTTHFPKLPLWGLFKCSENIKDVLTLIWPSHLNQQVGPLLPWEALYSPTSKGKQVFTSSCQAGEHEACLNLFRTLYSQLPLTRLYSKEYLKSV